MSDSERKAPVMYVSWGGTGRSEALRAAVDRAGDAGLELRYLAILDNEEFGELSPTLTTMVEEELAWLLTAQLKMIDLQTGPDVRSMIDVRRGDVEEVIITAAKDLDCSLILLGAPLPKDLGAARRKSIDDLLASIRTETGADVEVVGPEA